MSREEALDALNELLELAKTFRVPPHIGVKKIQGIIAALSSPYGEPIARGRAIHIENPTLGNYWVVYERELAADDTRHVVLFDAPLTEEP